MAATSGPSTSAGVAGPPPRTAPPVKLFLAAFPTAAPTIEGNATANVDVDDRLNGIFILSGPLVAPPLAVVGDGIDMDGFMDGFMYGDGDVGAGAFECAADEDDGCCLWDSEAICAGERQDVSELAPIVISCDHASSSLPFSAHGTTFCPARRATV